MDGYAPPAQNTPEDALRAAERAGVSGHVLNSFDFGGYLIFRGVPVFIDGRAEMYGDTFLERYLDATNLTDARQLPLLLKRYQVEWTLLRRGTPAVAVLDRMPGWRRVYTDDLAVVHIHDGVGIMQPGMAH
jgi:hypothetical protein